MRLDDYDYEEPKASFLTKAALVISSAVVLVFIVVLMLNDEKISVDIRKQNAEQVATLSPEEQKRLDEKLYVESLLSENGITSDQLGFWDLYSISEETVAAEDMPVIEPEVVETKEELPPSEDGLHTKIVYANGEEEWVKINTYLETNTYDFGGLMLDGELMKYYENSSLKSFVGVEVSKADGEVNFYQFLRSGVNFSILKLGQRGYQSGEILQDDKFETNLKACVDAGMPIGISFNSYAASEEEAVEEANYIIEQLNSYHEVYEFELAYPIMICLEPVLNDSSRTDELDKNERTLMIKTIFGRLQEEGYSVMLSANKEWLVQKMYLSHLNEYDICLDQLGDVPDYPYQFVMWHYSNNAVLKGCDNPLNMCISFVDFSIR